MSRKERALDELRPVEFQRGFTRHAAGSVLIRCGHTHVLCTASVSAGVPAWREASGLGWVTAEYDMLPSATNTRRARNRSGQLDGRTQEIQRLIGRALRSVIDFAALGSNTIQLDCDVLQADGGTRTASITGAYVALCDAVAAGQRSGQWGAGVLKGGVAAVSVGVVEGFVCLDLDYAEDVAAEVDGNFALTTAGQWVEVQMTGERATLSDAQLQEMLRVGRAGIERLLAAQRAALAQS